MDWSAKCLNWSILTRAHVPRQDLWSIGCILHFMLTKQTLYAGQHAQNPLDFQRVVKQVQRRMCFDIHAP